MVDVGSTTTFNTLAIISLIVNSKNYILNYIKDINIKFKDNLILNVVPNFVDGSIGSF